MKKTSLLLALALVATSTTTFSAQTNEAIKMYGEGNQADAVVTSEEVETTSSDKMLYSTVPASESVTGNDVCVYVSSKNSSEYTDLVNKERATWGLDKVSTSSDLQEGAMLRAGENIDLYARGKQSSKISHDTKEYAVTDASLWGENLSETEGVGYDANDAYYLYYSEKQDLPSDFNPEEDWDMSSYAGNVVGHYVNMVNPGFNYVGQGAAYSDENCDGSAEYIVYANEHSKDSKDLYPDLESEIKANSAETNNDEHDVVTEVPDETVDEGNTTTDGDTPVTSDDTATDISTSTDTTDTNSNAQEETTQGNELVNTSKNTTKSVVIMGVAGALAIGATFVITKRFK